MQLQFSLTNSNINSVISTTDETATLIHIWGDVGVGKTTLCYSATLSKLAQGKKVIYISTKSFFKHERFTKLKQYYSDFDEYNFLLYTPSNFSQQTEILMNLEFLILKEINILKRTQIGLIVLDSASILWHLEMKKSEHNNKTMRALNTTIATLDYIRRTYEIPILITNRSVIRIKDDKNIAQPANNTVMNFWAKIRMKIERTQQPAIRSFNLEMHPHHPNLPFHFRSELTEKGFI